jgi:ABC-type glutathione transport system ATPase component
METLLQVTDLTICYRSGETFQPPAVDRLSFRIGMGETVGVTGESGCGKTSVALALLGLLPADKASLTGSIRLRGWDLAYLNERPSQEIRGAGISMVHQAPGIALSPVMRVGQQIAEILHAHRRWNWKRCRSETHSMFHRVGLSPTDRIFLAYPHELSGGELQRVSLAQALICRPALVIADEPAASLDARSQAGFIALLRELKEDLRLSLLLISQSPGIQASLADRLLVMKDGRIVEEGCFGEVYRNPTDRYKRALLRGDSAAIEKQQDNLESITQEQMVR